MALFISLNIFNGIKHCFNPCGNNDYYLYSNGTCLNNCPSPLLNRTESEAKYCFSTCSPGAYLYDNGSCISTCNSPFLKISTEFDSRCLLPCKNSSHYFYTTENYCKEDCNTPHTIQKFDVIKVCYISFNSSQEEIDKAKETSDKLTNQGKLTGNGMKASSALQSNNPALIALAEFATMLLYIRYIKVKYPHKVLLLFMTQNSSSISLSFGIELPEIIEEKLQKQALPENFEQYDVHSSFLYNFWDTLMTLGLIMTAVLVINVIKALTKKYRKIKIILEMLLIIIKWNIPLMVFCGGIGDIVFYASLEFKTFDSSSVFSKISILICFTMMALAVWIMLKAFFIVADVRRDSENNEKKQKWKDYQLFYSEYKEQNFFGLAYMPFFLLRTSLFNFIIANLYNSPLVQAISIFALSLLMLIYIVAFLPFKSYVGLVQVILNELLIAWANGCVLTLAILDKTGVENEIIRDLIGDIIVQINVIFSIFGLVFLAIQVLVSLASICGILYASWKQGIRSPLKMMKNLAMNLFNENKQEKMAKTFDSEMVIIENSQESKRRKNFKLFQVSRIVSPQDKTIDLESVKECDNSIENSDVVESANINIVDTQMELERRKKMMRNLISLRRKQNRLKEALENTTEERKSPVQAKQFKKAKVNLVDLYEKRKRLEEQTRNPIESDNDKQEQSLFLKKLNQLKFKKLKVKLTDVFEKRKRLKELSSEQMGSENEIPKQTIFTQNISQSKFKEVNINLTEIFQKRKRLKEVNSEQKESDNSQFSQ